MSLILCHGFVASSGHGCNELLEVGVCEAACSVCGNQCADADLDAASTVSVYCSCFRFIPLALRGSLVVLKWHCAMSVLDVSRKGTSLKRKQVHVMAAASQSTLLKSSDTLNVQVVCLFVCIYVHVDAVVCKQRGHAWHHCIHQAGFSHTATPGLDPTV